MAGDSLPAFAAARLGLLALKPPLLELDMNLQGMQQRLVHIASSHDVYAMGRFNFMRENHALTFHQRDPRI